MTAATNPPRTRSTNRCVFPLQLPCVGLVPHLLAGCWLRACSLPRWQVFCVAPGRGQVAARGRSSSVHHLRSICEDFCVFLIVTCLVVRVPAAAALPSDGAVPQRRRGGLHVHPRLPQPNVRCLHFPLRLCHRRPCVLQPGCCVCAVCVRACREFTPFVCQGAPAPPPAPAASASASATADSGPGTGEAAGSSDGAGSAAGDGSSGSGGSAGSVTLRMESRRQ